MELISKFINGEQRSNWWRLTGTGGVLTGTGGVELELVA